MTDSHVHLNHPDFESDFDLVIERAREAGVTQMVNIGFDLQSSLETASLVERYPFMFGAVGVHPHDAKTYTELVEKKLDELLDQDRIVAVGEIGLDFYRDLTPRDVQRDVFRKQLRLARRKAKPIIIHCRDAFRDVIDVLKKDGDSITGIFHAFTGDADMAREVLDLGFHIGIGGVVTFKNSGLAEVVAGLPPDRILLETDCPYLTPAPYRGKRNEPSYVQHVARRISESTGRSLESIIESTDNNFADVMQLNN